MSGFFSYRIKGKRKISDYIKYKEVKKRSSDKKYWTINLIKYNYYDYLRTIKNGVYGIIERALTALQNMNVLEYSVVNVGIKTEANIKLPQELSNEENEKYTELNDQALAEILSAYNKITKKNKKRIKEKDLVLYPNLLEKYYSKLEALVKDKLKYESVFEYYKIKLTNLNNRVLDEFDTIRNEEELKNFKRKLNARYYNNLKNNAMKIYKKKSERNEDLNELEDNKDRVPDEKVEYYNKIEIIDQLVSFESVIDVIGE